MGGYLVNIDTGRVEGTIVDGKRFDREGNPLDNDEPILMPEMTKEIVFGLGLIYEICHARFKEMTPEEWETGILAAKATDWMVDVVMWYHCREEELKRLK